MTILIDLGPDYKGRMFGPPFYVSRQDGYAPGWFVLGSNEEYGGRLRKIVARPNVPARNYKYWNGQVRRGWWLKREAQVVADMLNKGN